MSREDAPGFGEPTIKYEECYFCDHYVTKERKCALYLFRFCFGESACDHVCKSFEEIK